MQRRGLRRVNPQQQQIYQHPNRRTNSSNYSNNFKKAPIDQESQGSLQLQSDEHEEHIEHDEVSTKVPQVDGICYFCIEDANLSSELIVQTQNKYPNHTIFYDNNIKDTLSYNDRPSIDKILELAQEDNIRELVIVNKLQVGLGGYNLLEHILLQHGCKIIIDQNLEEFLQTETKDYLKQISQLINNSINQ